MKIQTPRRFLSRLASRRAARMLVAIAGLPILLSAGMIHRTVAATYTWDPTGTNPTAPAGGGGTWDLTNAYWSNGATDNKWTDITGKTDTADFAGTAGTVTLGANLGALGLIFDTAGYTMGTGTFTLLLGTGGITSNATSGTTTINGAITSVGSQSWTVASGGTLSLGATFTSATSTNYNLTLAGAGSTNFTGGSSGTPNLVTGVFNASGGTVGVSGYLNTNSTTLANTKFIVNGGSTINWSGTGTQSGIYTGIADGSAGTLNVTAGSFMASPATGGSLFIGNNAVGLVKVTGGSLTVGSSLPVYLGDGYNGGGGTGSGTITISGGQFTTGTTTGSFVLGSTTLAGTGTINLNGGTFTTNRAFSGSKGTINFNGGTLQASGTTLTIPSTGITTTIQDNGGTIDTQANAIGIAANITHGGTAATDGGLTKLGSGALTLSGTDTFNGQTVISNGSIITGSALALGSSTLNYNNQGGTLSFGTLTAATLGGLTGSQALALANTTPAAVTLSVGNNNTSTTYAGVLSGAGALTKVGTGTLTLTGTNTYTGGTTLSAGILSLGSAQPLGGTGTVASVGTIIFSGGTLQYSAANQTDYSSRFSGGASQAFNIDTNGQTVTFASQLTASSGGSLTKSGTGTLILTGTTPSYSGNTTISAGTLQLGNATTTGAVPSGSNIVDNAALVLNRSGSAWTLANVISGTGTVTQSGAATVTLSGNNTYTGATTINGFVDTSSATAFGTAASGTTINTGGTVRFRDTSLTVAEPFILNGGSFITYNDPNTTTFTGQFTLNTNSVIQTSPQVGQTNTITVFSNSFVEGGTASSLSFVRVSAAGAGSNDVVNLTGASTYGGGTFVADALNTNTGIYSLKLSGGNDRLPIGTTVTLGGANAGGNAAGSGRLILGDATTGAISQTLAGLTTNGTGTNNSVIGAAPAVSTLVLANPGANTFNGVLGGTATNANNLALSMSGAGVLTLGGANTYVGGTAVNSGTLTAASDSALGSANAANGVSLAPAIGVTATLNFTSATPAVASLASGGAGTSNVVLGSLVGPTALTVGGTGNVFSTFAGTITDGSAANSAVVGSLVKAGTGTLTLSGANTYTGTTTINAGTLLAANTGGSATGTGAVTVKTGGTLGGIGNVGGTVAVNSGGTVSAGSGTTTGVLNVGALTLAASSTFNAVVASDAAYSQLTANSGTTNLSNAAFTITLPAGATFAAGGEALTLIASGITGAFTNASYTTGGYTFTADYTTTPGAFDVDVAPVPEPATCLAGLLTFGALGFSQRRRLRGLFRGVSRTV